MSKRLYRAAGLISLLCLWPPSLGAEASGRSTENAIKAAYLYNFAKFVEWPPEKAKSGPFCVGILGNDPFGSDVEAALSNKTIQDRPLQVRHVQNLEQAAQCDIVFITDDDTTELSTLLPRLREASVLTVGNGRPFVHAGGIVGFQVVHNNLRFDINLTAAQSAHLKISSQLLKVAHSVEGAPDTAP